MDKPEGIENLVKSAQRGDTHAFGLIYDAYVNKLLRYIRLKVQNTEDSEDLLQEVFVKAWHGLPQFESRDGNFNAWIYRIASNAINDYFRKKYRRPETLELNETIDIVSSENVEDEVDRRLGKGQLEAIFEKLPPQYKEVLELRFVQDFTLEETAKILRKSNVSVRVLQHRAFKKLQHVTRNMKHEA